MDAFLGMLIPNLWMLRAWRTALMPSVFGMFGNICPVLPGVCPLVVVWGCP